MLDTLKTVPKITTAKHTILSTSKAVFPPTLKFLNILLD
jgi:hypothetical protein